MKRLTKLVLLGLGDSILGIFIFVNIFSGFRYIQNTFLQAIIIAGVMCGVFMTTIAFYEVLTVKEKSEIEISMEKKERRYKKELEHYKTARKHLKKKIKKILRQIERMNQKQAELMGILKRNDKMGRMDLIEESIAMKACFLQNVSGLIDQICFLDKKTYRRDKEGKHIEKLNQNICTNEEMLKLFSSFVEEVVLLNQKDSGAQMEQLQMAITILQELRNNNELIFWRENHEQKSESVS